MPLISESEAAAIRDRAKRLAAGDEHGVWNMTELGAALAIISKFLGSRWYQKSAEGLTSPLPDKPPPNYDFLLKRGAIPPITALLKGGMPQNYIRLIQFADFLRALEPGTNVREKLGEYERKERKANISMDSFNSLFFELKIAAYFRRKGFRVRFVPEEKKKKTPDLQVSSPEGTLYVECKKKRPQTREEVEISDACYKIEVGILNFMMTLRANYAITITFRSRVGSSDVESVVAASKQIIASQEQEGARSIGESVRIEGRRLLPIDVPQSSKALPRPPDLKLVQHFTWSAETQDPNINLMRIHALDVVVRNYRSVAIFSSYIPHKVNSVLNSVKDAATQFASDDWIGMVAVEVALGNRTPEDDLRQILAHTPETLAQLPGVSAAIYCLEQDDVSQPDITSVRTIFHGYRNPTARRPLPPFFLEAMKTTVEEGMVSLLS